MTLNEVNIIKNSVLDATEAYVDARLAVADFAKTQIGVTEGEPIKKSSKYYHKVRCNAIKGVEGSGVLYQNVLAVGNTAFPAGSVVFVIAPNAQFSNQFILGKLDNTPIEIVGGSIKIGGTNPDADPVFQVATDGTVTIKKGGVYLNKSGSYYNLILDSTGIKLGHYSGETYNFTVNSSDGTVTIRKGQINLGAVTVSGSAGYDVNINKNGINLGYLGQVNGVDTYTFSVTDKGKVTIKEGSIKIADKFYVVDTGDLFIGGTDAITANFYVTHTGDVTIKQGRLNFDYNSTLQGYNFIVNNYGMSLGIKGNSSTDKYYNFSVDNDGKVTIKEGSINIADKFYVTDQGDLFLGGTNISNSSFYMLTTDNLVMIKSGSMTLGSVFHIDSTGWLSIGGTSSNAPFYVSTDGSLTMQKGSITLGTKFKIDTSGNLSIGGLDSTANFYVDNSDGSVTIKRGSIDIGSGKFYVDSQGNLTAKYLTANVGGQIAGFTISSSTLSVGDAMLAANRMGCGSGGHGIVNIVGGTTNASNCYIALSNSGRFNQCLDGIRIYGYQGSGSSMTRGVVEIYRNNNNTPQLMATKYLANIPDQPIKADPTTGYLKWA